MKILVNLIYKGAIETSYFKDLCYHNMYVTKWETQL